MAYPVPMWAGANFVESGFLPHSPSLATSSLGNYAYAMLVQTYKNITTQDTNYFTSDGSGFSRTAVDESLLQLSFSAVDFQTWCNDTAGATTTYCGAYIRTVSGIPLFSYVGQNVSYSLSNSCTFAINPGATYLTTQDATSINPSTTCGITTGDFLTLTFGGGRGSILYPQAGDTLEWEVEGGDGTISPFLCKVEVTFT